MMSRLVLRILTNFSIAAMRSYLPFRQASPARDNIAFSAPNKKTPPCHFVSSRPHLDRGLCPHAVAVVPRRNSGIEGLNGLLGGHAGLLANENLHPAELSGGRAVRQKDVMGTCQSGAVEGANVMTFQRHNGFGKIRGNNWGGGYAGCRKRMRITRMHCRGE